MILTSRGRSIDLNGAIYYVGMPVIARACPYEGLHGEITEIRTAEDLETGNPAPDFHCKFLEPNDWMETERLELRFSKLCGMPKTLQGINMDDVVMAADMLTADCNRMVVDNSVKRVVWNTLSKRFEQWQALKKDGQDCYTLQTFNDELQLMEEIESDYHTDWEVLFHWRHKCESGFFQMLRGISCDVLRLQTWDTTNGGISSRFNTLSLIGDEICSPFEVSDIRATVRLCQSGSMWQCYPLIFPTSWHMSGGNFIYSSDSRFQKICGYPIAVLDRREGS